MGKRTCVFTVVFALVALGILGAAATQVALNSSFEYPAVGDATHAQDWSLHSWWPGGYKRVAVPDPYDLDSYVMEVSNPPGVTPKRAGGFQPTPINPPSNLVRISVAVRPNGISSASGAGANLYCEIKYTDNTVHYDRPWQLPDQTGTSQYWREIGFNTAQLPNGNKLVSNVMCGPELEPVTGKAQFDDYMVEVFQPMTKGALTFMGDDGTIGQYTKAFPIFKSRNFPLSIAAVLNFIGKTGYMNDAQLKAIQAAGGSIESHTDNHLDLTKISKSSMQHEIWWAMDQLRKKGYGAKHLILPFGAYNPEVLEYAQWFHDSVRNTWRASNPAGTFRLDVRTQEIQNATTFNEVKQWVDEASLNKKWVIVMFHEVKDICPTGEAGKYCTTSSLLSQIASYVASQNIDVVNYDQGFRRTQN